MNTKNGLILCSFLLLNACSVDGNSPAEADTAGHVKSDAAADVERTSENSPKNSSSTSNSSIGWDPQKACRFLSDIPGMSSSGSYSSLYEGIHSCGTRYKDVGEDDHSALPNNISYYAAGTPEKVQRLRLLLNINQISNDTAAKEQMATVAVRLFQAALNHSIPNGIQDSIKTGTSGQWDDSGYKIELKKDIWPTGKGYELNFVIRDPAFEDIR